MMVKDKKMLKIFLTAGILWWINEYKIYEGVKYLILREGEREREKGISFDRPLKVKINIGK